ncbi:MAG TPA: UvrD-helicase domain-containing protein, partial [Anaerolineaceae bacterium]
MPALVLTPPQVEIVRQPIRASIFLEGPAGCGKTTAAVERMLALLSGGFSPDQLLVLAPQRSLLAPFQARLRESALAPGGLPDLLTVNGLAQRLIELFWPLVASEAGFALPDQPPTFLTIETAQYYMAHLVRPLLDQGYFESVSIDRNRLYSQILDNLNKAALAGFPHTEIGERLSAAWKGESAQRRVYQDVQACADRFRDYCLGHNLLDFSLQMELLAGTLWQSEPCRTYLTERYSGLIYDNIEEDTPLAHDLIAGLLPRLDSSMLVMDWDAGYRRYLGADPEDACRLKLPGAEVRALTGPLVS